MPSRRGAAAATADSARANARAAALKAAQERTDSLRALKNANRRPTLNWADRYATRFSEKMTRSPFILRDPKGVTNDVRLDPTGGLAIYERVGNGTATTQPGAVPPTLPANAQLPAVNSQPPVPAGSRTNLPYRLPETVPLDSYNQIQNQRATQSIWREYGTRRDGQSSVSGRGLIPKLELPPIVDRIFGGTEIDFKPNGFVTLDFGYLYQFIDNPQLPVRQRRQGNFLFNEQISINFNGKIGERLGVLANYDTKAAFNFENALKLNYKPQGLVPNIPRPGAPGVPSLPGLPNAPNLPGMPSMGTLDPTTGIPQFQAQNESIIQGLEAGNLSWQLNSQLIPGVQNLFGAKVQTRFGRLNATFVASQQRSRQQTITLRGGSVGRPFEIKASQYDENRHFFLSQFFRNNYERSLKSLPQITSGVTITRLEVYVTNRTNTTETLRNVAGFADLGEASPYNRANPLTTPTPGAITADNTANALYRSLTQNPAIRQVDRASEELTGTLGFQKSIDYDLLRGAKRLTEREYKFHPELGYISLVTQLRNDEVLAVSYEYTYQGRKYQVGELTENYQSRRDDEVLVLKLLKSATIRNNLQLPMWNLMMKNIYNLNTTQLARQNFQLRIIYKDDLTGIDNPNLQEGSLVNQPLVQVFGMDRLNQQQDPQPDGNFDFVENITIDSRFGRVIFPTLEPFGSFLSRQFNSSESDLQAKYVFDELYRTTQADAIQITAKDKFFLKGSFQSGAGGQEVQLPYGVNQSSVQVTAGGVPLMSGQDFQFDGSTGRLRITNEGVTNSGREIRITFEQPDLFQNQIRTLVGTRLDYLVSPDFRIGFTGMRMRETPAGFLTRVAIGNEPVNNTILGLDMNIRRESGALTRFLDRLPLLQTKETSLIQFQGEVAQIIPGVAPRVNDNSFVDDFEAARTVFDLTRQPNRWRLGATPLQFPQGSFTSPLEYGYNRAQVSVYSIDPSIYGDNLGNGITTNLTEEDKRNVHEQYFLPTDLFPGKSQPPIQLPQNVLDVSYFPSERGMYNYNPDLTTEGKLKNPRRNFGSVTRAVTSDIDFDNANIENITFWLMDPFTQGPNGKVRGNPDDTKNFNNTTGGKLIFNLGDISEDVVKDGRYNFENGLPISSDVRSTIRGVDSTAWGRVTRQQFITNAFSNEANARQQQDIGLDGLDNTQERTFFQQYLNDIRTRVTNTDAFQQIARDPSNDDFKYYLGSQADSARYIVSRYKNFIGMENNSPENSTEDRFITPSSTNLPDLEDLNVDNTINDNDAYYEYEIDLRPGKQVVGQGYIIDKVESKGATWYLYRMPVREFARKVGNINGFKSIRFMRMYLTDFEQPVVLRFAQLQMESNQYRKYLSDLNQRGLQEVPEPYDAQFKVSTVNIEENGPNNVQQTGPNPALKYIYTVPPGFVRDRDFTQISTVELNEQSMALSVTNLRDGDSRAAFRNTNFDFLFRKRLRMFVHMHNEQNESGQVAAFMRIGTDFTDNYYEVEIPKLQATQPGVGNNEGEQSLVWPTENDLDIALEDFVNLKAERDRALTRRSLLPFAGRSADGRYNITVVGNPDLSSVQMVMIGVRNPRSPDEQAKSFTVWVDELRTNGYDQTNGQAAIGTLNMKLADFATITASGKIQTFGFGGVQSKIGDRSRDFTTEYGITSAIQVDKLFPEKWGLKIPLYLSFDNRKSVPQFNPLNPDTPLKQALETLPESERSGYRKLVEDITNRKGINFSNVRKIRTNTAAKPHFYDIENFGFTYAFNEGIRSNVLTGEYIQRQQRGGIAYTYVSQPKSFEPFKNVKSLDRKYLFWIKDLNLTLLPTLVSFRTDADRSFVRTQLRNAELTTDGIAPQIEKYFLFNRFYDATWNLTKSLVMTYRGQANSIIDEPFGDINTQAKKDSVWKSVMKLGRMKNFQQDIRFTYRLPLDKIPLLNWIAADATYSVGYQFQANSFGLRDSTGVLFGNTLRNNRERGITGRVDLIQLYNKIKSLRWANTPSPIRKNFARSPGDVEDIVRSDNRVLKSVVRTLLTVRGINFSYSVQESTVLPGFVSAPRFFGLDRSGAPGLGFVLGSQDRTIQARAARNGWTSPSIVQNTPFQQTIARKFDARTTLEPFKDFRMQLDLRLTRSDAYQEFYRPRTLGGEFESQTPVRNGQFNMSFWSFRTAFKPIRNDNSSPIFEAFEANRIYFRDKLNAESKANNETGLYNSNSQDVLIPAFFSAYSGRPKEKTSINPFLKFPLPNWRVDYTGLAALPMFKKRFTSLNLTHSYVSNYSVGNYVSSLDYGAAFVNLSVMGYERGTLISDPTLNQYVPIFVMSTITMSEKFAPVIGVQMQTKNRISGRLEYNQSRDVALNLSNAQIAELTNKDITGSLGFTRQNVRLPFKVGGAVKRLKNDLTFSCALTFRDTRAIQRKLDGEHIITAGNVNFQLRPQVSYIVNKRLNMNVYFDRTFNDPLVSNSFRRATTAGGVQLRFSLAQ